MEEFVDIGAYELSCNVLWDVLVEQCLKIIENGLCYVSCIFAMDEFKRLLHVGKIDQAHFFLKFNGHVLDVGVID